MADVLKKVPVREQEPKVRATNFEEVCYGYNKEEAMEEATRCLNCKNARCIQGCPVSINIPAFIAQIKDGNIEEAYKVIGQSSALPAICGRVCPQESQCESKCVRGIKGDAVSIGKLERFVADYALENDIKPEKPEKIRAAMKEILEKKKLTQPLEYPSAGSIFRAEGGAPAGLLIDRAGLKGLRAGGAEISLKHANFIVNKGGATAKDILELMDAAGSAVKRKFGVVLRPEIKYLGDTDDIGRLSYSFTL